MQSLKWSEKLVMSIEESKEQLWKHRVANMNGKIVITILNYALNITVSLSTENTAIKTDKSLPFSYWPAIKVNSSTLFIIRTHCTLNDNWTTVLN